MSDLAEFLLARTAEYEAIARERDYDNEFGLAGFCEWTGDRPDRELLTIHPDRLLAECQARRAIVALHPEAVADELRPGAAWAYDEALRRLALPYAGHPDYREEWRP